MGKKKDYDHLACFPADEQSCFVQKYLNLEHPAASDKRAS
jgi:hypothetical protein